MASYISYGPKASIYYNFIFIHSLMNWALVSPHAQAETPPPPPRPPGHPSTPSTITPATAQLFCCSEDHQCRKISQWSTSYHKNSKIYRDIFIRQFSNDIMYDITAHCQQKYITQFLIKYLQTAMTVWALGTKNLITRIVFHLLMNSEKWTCSNYIS